jgi:ring-1,2-phenylacetyl-CoA epoxidase subunit PaaB
MPPNGGRRLLNSFAGDRAMNDEKQETKQERELMPLWEVFIRPRTGLSHSHVGSVHASDEVMAVQAARDVYTRRGEGVSIWVVASAQITASDPDQRDENFEPAETKIYRHPSFYDIPDDVGHM